MKIEIHTRKSDNTCNFEEAHKANFVKRIERSLKHLSDQIVEVQIHLEDESPSKNKFDGHCKIHVVFRKGKPVAVESHGESYTDLIADSVDRVHHAVTRIFDKKKDKRQITRAVQV